MDCILKNLENLDRVKSFVSFLEVRAISNDKLFTSLAAAKMALNKATIKFLSDLEKRLGNDNYNEIKLGAISNEVIDAANHLKFFNDLALTKKLKDMVDFFLQI
ncbi:MAG: hypothetical protein A2887_04125 [Alphaproteobacteria bacterium RIFCSPLOWO2_01_FULL_40_26]|nr:MAG: hypothetical protein A3D15_01910 [Alphaproteobacteria bacterium RIFCSPHIGHO2_02_FULL_40_34]OFW85606.1 MAG: hypothetical protein A2794_00405 [Alphaproteobacteria bacterium RIFCSPHIGHO2_01_FULL_40_8]OFW93924.1 MAG: hypothetical protein A2887_04125 [Alphaproteobacteria bacterium RIFCSPLOWO2_01_FULL_40_26]OFX09418.1 MAG: hypothetical protein A3H30_01740 [Alphaproteobacteria bacterium RIFCSPLOWO2_02_FULL_40_19]OFX11965.1 MAG: hypothetical protein A3G22_05275 [Alphaproteobacteria bacterium RI